MSFKNLVGFIHELPALHKGLFIHRQGSFLFFLFFLLLVGLGFFLFSLNALAIK